MPKPYNHMHDPSLSLSLWTCCATFLKRTFRELWIFFIFHFFIFSFCCSHSSCIFSSSLVVIPEMYLKSYNNNTHALSQMVSCNAASCNKAYLVVLTIFIVCFHLSLECCSNHKRPVSSKHVLHICTPITYNMQCRSV